MKILTKIFSVLLCLSLASFVFSGCNKDDDGEIANTMTLRGVKYGIAMGIYFSDGQFTHIDVDTSQGDDNLHGYGQFASSMIGKTTPAADAAFDISFNPMSGPSIDPVIKSGNITIKKVEKGLHIVVDCVEVDGQKFYMDYLAESEADFNARQ